jgi:uncharacterized protein
MELMNKGNLLVGSKDNFTLESFEKTDFFIDMVTHNESSNAPFYNVRRTGDFIIKAKIKPAFKKTYDAGGILIYDTTKKWVKFAFEQTDLGYSSVVSVVTNKVSDDGNGEKIEGIASIWMQVIRKGTNWVLHYSTTGKTWKMVRYFQLSMKPEVRIGIIAQSPLGTGCKVNVSGLIIDENRLLDIRKGK